MTTSKLDPVTFEVLRNAFINLVDQMSNQLLKTCYSFVIYNHDFSNCLCDAEGNTVTQGTQDIASHIGTLHWTAKAVIKYFTGRIYPGDVYMINDPYLGATHFPDVRIMRPIFVEEQLIGFTQSNGHWADVGGHVPGSFDVSAKDYYSEGVRIPPIKIVERGVYRDDIANMITSNMRVPHERLGDLRAQLGATTVGENRLQELINKYGVDVILAAFEECQDYVERIMRKRLAELPQGTWQTVDYLDEDPNASEGMLPIHIKMTLTGKEIIYDFTGTHRSIKANLNSALGVTYSAIAAGTKTFFPDIPLNSGFYRVMSFTLPEDSLVNAAPPAPVCGSVSGAFEKTMNGLFEMWSQVMPERALACSFNLEYLLVGGMDSRSKPREFMWYDWLSGGWGGRNGKDGTNTTAPVFGVGLALQSCEIQERLAPVRVNELEMMCDSGGPGRFRGGVGLTKGVTLLDSSSDVVLSYSCDRGRSITWGSNGGLPSNPHGLWLNRPNELPRKLGVNIAAVPIQAGDYFHRPAAGGGGMGDPLDREPSAVLEDVKDEYVSIQRAAEDYGVVIIVEDSDLCRYRIDSGATATLRQRLRDTRLQKMAQDPEEVRALYRAWKIEYLDVIRHYGVILDLCDQACPVLTRTTEQFREAIARRSTKYWRSPLAFSSHA